MSKLILAASSAAAQALAAKAQAWLVANVAGYSATKWDDPMQHPTDGRWAIVFEDRLAPAFTATERGDVAGGTDAEGNAISNWTKVIDFSADWNPPTS